MSDLLSIGKSGVLAYRSALSAVADNVANAETPGYARRTARLEEAVNPGSGGVLYRAPSFSGVNATGLDRAWDHFRAAEARFAAAADGRAATREQWFGAVEGTLGDGPSSVGPLLGDFFNRAVVLAPNPDDRLGRTAMLTSLGNVADGIGAADAGLVRVSEAVGDAAKLDVDSVNTDLAALAKVNLVLQGSIAGTTTRPSLEDQRDRLVDALSKKLDITARFDTKGTATLTLGGAGGPLLLGPTETATLGLARAADGRLSYSLTSGGTTTAVTPAAGSLAGLADAAAITADRRTGLAELAEDFAASVNAWSRAGRDATGNPGGDLLAVAGPARLTLLTEDPAAIAAASADGTANGNLLALDELRGPSGAEARWAGLVSAQAQLVAGARSESTAAASRRDNAFAARDEVSGVDLDREAADLVRFQQAYNGAAKIIQVARETVDAILAIF